MSGGGGGGFDSTLVVYSDSPSSYIVPNTSSSSVVPTPMSSGGNTLRRNTLVNVNVNPAEQIEFTDLTASGGCRMGSGGGTLTRCAKNNAMRSSINPVPSPVLPPKIHSTNNSSVGGGGAMYAKLDSRESRV